MGTEFRRLIFLYIILLSFSEPPWFVRRTERIEVKVNDEANLKCHAHGDRPMTLMWTHNGAIVPASPR